jgi:hypothetical protein
MLMGPWAFGLSSGLWPWAFGLLGTWALKVNGSRAHGLSGTLALGHFDSQALHWGTRARALLGSWDHGPLGTWAFETFGLMDSWAHGLLGSWPLGLMGP